MVDLLEWLAALVLDIEQSKSKTGVLNLYSLIYPLANFRRKINSPNFFYIFTSTSPIVIGKSVNLLQTKFTPKARQFTPGSEPLI